MAKAVMRGFQQGHGLVRQRTTVVEGVPLFACGTCMYLRDLVWRRLEIDFYRIDLTLKQDTPTLLDVYR